MSAQHGTGTQRCWVVPTEAQASSQPSPADPGQQAVLQAHRLAQLGRPDVGEHGLAQEHLPGPPRRHCGDGSMKGRSGQLAEHRPGAVALCASPTEGESPSCSAHSHHVSTTRRDRQFLQRQPRRPHPSLAPLALHPPPAERQSALAAGQPAEPRSLLWRSAGLGRPPTVQGVEAGQGEKVPINMPGKPVRTCWPPANILHALLSPAQRSTPQPGKHVWAAHQHQPPRGASTLSACKSRLYLGPWEVCGPPAGSQPASAPVRRCKISRKLWACKTRGSQECMHGAARLAMAAPGRQPPQPGISQHTTMHTAAKPPPTSVMRSPKCRLRWQPARSGDAGSRPRTGTHSAKACRVGQGRAHA